MKDVLVLVFSNLKHDARVMRQINWLKKNHSVTVVCFDAEDDPALTIIRIAQTKLTPVRKAMLGAALLARQYGLAYRLFHDYSFLAQQLAEKEFALIMANDIDTLPLAFQFRKKTRIIFDAHEYAPRHFENNRIWRLFFQPFYIYLCKKYIPLVDGMLTVGKGLAREYEKNFGVKPVIITNAMSGSSCWIRPAIVRPSIPGNRISSRTMSKRSRESRSSASSAVPAISQTVPARSRILPTRLRMPGSSSTISVRMVRYAASHRCTPRLRDESGRPLRGIGITDMNLHAELFLHPPQLCAGSVPDGR